MNVRAKFSCATVTKDSSKNETVTLQAVSDDVNKAWSRWTPGGQLSLTISEEGAQGHFEPGRCYYLDISPVE